MLEIIQKNKGNIIFHSIVTTRLIQNKFDLIDNRLQIF